MQFISGFSACSSVWLLHFSRLSILTPSNVTSAELSILFLPIFKTKESSSFVPRTINWNFPGFAFIEFLLNQVKTLFRSVSRFPNTISNSLLELYKVLLSAKLRTSDNVITKNKLFINVLKSKGPKIEPWGTRLIISYQKLYEEPIFFSLLTARGNQESMTVLSYQFHNIPIWLLEDLVVYNHAFDKSIKTVPTDPVWSNSFCQNEVTWIKQVGCFFAFQKPQSIELKKLYNLIIVYKLVFQRP